MDLTVDDLYLIIGRLTVENAVLRRDLDRARLDLAAAKEELSGPARMRVTHREGVPFIHPEDLAEGE